MELTTTNNNQMFVSEFKELRNELMAVKKRIVQLEESDQKQQERLDMLEKENHALKIQLNISGSKEGESALKRKREEKDQDQGTEDKIDSASSSTSTGKKSKTHDDDDEEAVVIPQRDNGDSFDSLSDDLLHKIVEFDGNCYNKFGSINKRCKNIYDVKEYKLKKQTCVYGYGTLEMMLQHYLKRRREGGLSLEKRIHIAAAVVIYKRLDAIGWILQLGDIKLLKWVCCFVAYDGKINILSKVFCKLNLTTVDLILDDINMCYNAAENGKLQTLKWLRYYGATLSSSTYIVARDRGHDEIVQYLRAEGCPGTIEITNESSVGSDDEDIDN